MQFHKIAKEWEDLIRALSISSGSIVYAVINASGDVVFANDTMCYFLGTRQEELAPQNKFINPDIDKILSLSGDSDLVFEGILTIGNFIDKNYVLDSKIFKRNGTFLIFAETDILHLFEENGKMSRLNQEVNNLQRQLIKEKKILQKTLNTLKETQQMLVHSEKMNALGQMIAGVAHEINNPIAFVTNNLYELDKNAAEFINAYDELELEIEKHATEELKEIVRHIRVKNEIDYLSEDIGEIINESKSGVERVKKIVEDLRKFSRLDESDLKRIDLTENIRSTLTIVQSEIRKKNIQFHFETQDQIFMDCFPGQLNQAILNVLLNAIHAVENGGQISLKIIGEPNRIFIIVEDNGCGIHNKSLKKIFDPFYTTKPIGTGTGLGLSITYKIINDLHKGKIEVRSVLDEGTIFTFVIPKEIKI